MNVAVGSAIRAVREEQSITQQALARELGLGVSSVDAVEDGRLNLTLETLVEIATALGVSAPELLRRALG